jgi:programmed cell death protein 10
VPEQIEDRTKFLGIIRTIAGNIKDVLETVSEVFTKNTALLGSKDKVLEGHKKVFVRVSKSFSETLKRFFKDGKKDAVLRSAHRLINQTNLLQRTIKTAMSESK